MRFSHSHKSSAGFSEPMKTEELVISPSTQGINPGSVSAEIPLCNQTNWLFSVMVTQRSEKNKSHDPQSMVSSRRQEKSCSLLQEMPGPTSTLKLVWNSWNGNLVLIPGKKPNNLFLKLVSKNHCTLCLFLEYTSKKQELISLRCYEQVFKTTLISVHERSRFVNKYLFHPAKSTWSETKRED